METFKTYKRYEAWVRNHRNAFIKVLHTDRGGEYLSHEFTAHLEAQGTERVLTVHDTPQQNGVAERLNGILAEKVRAMLYDSGLPQFLWGEAVNHATWLKNHTLMKALEGRTPFEAVYGKPPNLAGLPVWGARIWVHDADASKIGTRAHLGRWVGYDSQSRGHHVYWPDKRSVTVERSVRFETDEVDLPPAHGNVLFEGEGGVAGNCNAPGAENAPNDSNLGEKPPKNAENSPLDKTGPPSARSDDRSMNTDTEAMSGRPQCTRNPSRYVRDILVGVGSATGPNTHSGLPPGVQAPSLDGNMSKGDGRSLEDIVEEVGMAAAVVEAIGLEPRSVEEARKRPDWPRWEEAINAELGQLTAMGTWEVVDKPVGVNVVGSKWVFKVKKDAAGNVERYKVQLVAQGYTQVPGVDYFDTFAPVAKLASIQSVLALAACHDWEIHQVNVKSAYLNGEFEDAETIYMHQPPGFPISDHPGKILHLL